VLGSLAFRTNQERTPYTSPTVVFPHLDNDAVTAAYVNHVRVHSERRFVYHLPYDDRVGGNVTDPDSVGRIADCRPR